MNNHFSTHLTAGTAVAAQTKTLISTQIIKDGNKEYPEIIDYHPEKKVSIIMTSLNEKRMYDRHRFSNLPFIFRLSLTTLTSKGGDSRTLSSSWTPRLAWVDLLVSIYFHELIIILMKQI